MIFAHSLTFRLAVFYAIVFCLSLLFIVSLAHLYNVEFATRALKSRILVERQDILRTYRSEGMAGLANALKARRHVEAERYPFDALVDTNGKVVTSNLPSWPSPSSSDWLRIEADLHLDGQEEDREALVLDHRMADGTRLLIGRNIEDIDDLEESIEGTATILLPLTLVLAVVGGAFMGRTVGRRIEALDAAARQIMGSTLSTRIPVVGNDDDLDRLAGTLNHMLARLEVAVDGLRRTSDSVAHELRTPLARLQAQLEDMLQNHPHSKLGLANAIQEVDALARMFDATLAVTRIESGRTTLPLGPVNMTEILSDAAELYAGVAEARRHQFDINVHPNLHAHGNADLLFQAACNLLDNAIKFTPAGRSVSLKAEAADQNIVVVVTDSGPGIPDELHQLVFERFYRAPTARSEPGLGMGLAYVAAVNALHHATMTLHSTGRGLRVEWRIPREPIAAS